MNSGPPVPQTGALTGLRYAPTSRRTLALHFKLAVQRRPLTPTSFVIIIKLLKVVALKLGPVLVLREPGPDHWSPSPTPRPRLGPTLSCWIVAFSGCLRSKYFSNRQKSVKYSGEILPSLPWLIGVNDAPQAKPWRDDRKSWRAS